MFYNRFASQLLFLPVAHPPLCRSITANIRKGCFISAVWRTERYLLNRLVEYKLFALFFDKADSIRGYNEYGSRFISLPSKLVPFHCFLTMMNTTWFGDFSASQIFNLQCKIFFSLNKFLLEIHKFHHLLFFRRRAILQVSVRQL